MHKTLTLSLAAIALATGGVAVAQTTTAAAAGEEARSPMRAMEHTREQAQQRAATMFSRLDVNGDGQLSDADREVRADQQFDKMDANGDGAISREEFAAMRENRTERREDRRAARTERGGERMARGEGRRGGPGMRGDGMRGTRRMLRAADADGNGAITQEEFISAALARFDAADADNDGTVTREERRNARPEGRLGRGRARG